MRIYAKNFCEGEEELLLLRKSHIYVLAFSEACMENAWKCVYIKAINGVDKSALSQVSDHSQRDGKDRNIYIYIWLLK